ncbi:MAG: ABC transporter ATP-binding protein, partial [Gemmatimonadetes bacterium]|nr:ABC transporter ATP-binding protein [Gemmatimonadota bacterium]
TDAPEGVRLGLRRRMATVFQRPAAFRASVFDNVAYGLRVRGVKGDALRRRVSRALETVELSGLERRDAHTLSGGELQRVALARAIVTEPDLLLLDEPTANLDPVSTRRIEALIGRVMTELNATVIMATHDMAQGQRLASRMGVLLGGRLLQTGTPQEVFSRPQDTEIAQFVGVENIYEGRVVSNARDLTGIDVGGATIYASGGHRIGARVNAFIRPEEVVLAESPLETSARNRFRGTVTGVSRQGPLAYVRLDCGFPLSACVTAVSADEMGLAQGKAVSAFFKATGVHVVAL